MDGEGLRISRRISTCEMGEAHATPEWVIAAGAQGGIYKAYRHEVWVPEYGDPIYLSKLNRFVSELARRYDGQPWLRYVDIGLGTWGEGHNHPMFDKAIPMEAVKSHIDASPEEAAAASMVFWIAIVSSATPLALAPKSRRASNTRLGR